MKIVARADRRTTRMQLNLLLCLVAGVAAIAVSVFLSFTVLFITQVGINALNSVTIFGCGLAGCLADFPRGRWMVAASAVLLIVGAAPGLIGGYAWLYLPSVLLFVLAFIVPGW